jgi:O-antigen ligase
MVQASHAGRNTFPGKLRVQDSFYLFTVFAGFSLAMPVVWGSIAFSLLLISWLIRGQWRDQLRRLRSSPAAIAVIALLVLYVIGTIYSTGPHHEATGFLSKYAKLMIIPIVVMALVDDKWKRHTINAFLIGLGVELVISYARRLGIIAEFPDPNQRFIGLINHISYGVMLAFGCYVLAWRALHATQWRIFWAICAILAIVNILFINSGRTGYVVFLSLFALFFIQHWKWRGIIVGGFIGLFLIASALTISPTARHRVEQIPQNIHQFSKGEDNTPVGLRLLHYREALEIIAKNPLIGFGTGSFSTEYKIAVAGTNNFIVSNPENEFLITMAQLGLPGLIVLLTFLIFFFIQARQMPKEAGHASQALIVTFVIGSVFNSILLDALEGRFFVLMAGVLLAFAPPYAWKLSKQGKIC